eukprot:9321537-Karenia_brevis.AAC.1
MVRARPEVGCCASARVCSSWIAAHSIANFIIVQGVMCHGPVPCFTIKTHVIMHRTTFLQGSNP